LQAACAQPLFFIRGLLLANVKKCAAHSRPDRHQEKKGQRQRKGPWEKREMQ
jgi:hypothetical protein